MTFNPREETNKIITFIQEYFKKNNLGGVVLGISGGKDSAVVAALFTKALGKENVIGVTLPCNSNLKDATDAKAVADKYGFKLINVDLTPIYYSFVNEVTKLEDFTRSVDSNINLKPRLRMTALYYIAQMYSTKTHKTYIVAGTGNKCEEFVGYFTKGGDGMSDIKVISDFTVEEVIKIGEVLEVPEQVLYKAPNDGLSGLSDEDKLGFKYSDVAKVMNGEPVDEDTKQLILKKHNQNEHKFITPTYKR